MQTKLPQIYFQSASTFQSNFFIIGFSSENFAKFLIGEGDSILVFSKFDKSFMQFKF